MGAGKYRHPLSLRTPAVSRDSEYQEIQMWTHLAWVWGEVIPLSGREYFASKGVNAELSHRVTIPFRHNLRPTMRFHYGSRILEIVSVVDLEERHIELECLCKEVIA